MNAALERIANAASNFLLAYDHVLIGYTKEESIGADLFMLEDAIRKYRAEAYLAYRARSQPEDKESPHVDAHG